LRRGKEISFISNDSGSADFSYAISAKVISITDLKPGKGSFVEEIEKLFRKITHWHQGSITGFRILCRDAEGLGSEVKWDGQQAKILQPRDSMN
jgi:hypothetical protein